MGDLTWVDSHGLAAGQLLKGEDDRVGRKMEIRDAD